MAARNLTQYRYASASDYYSKTTFKLTFRNVYNVLLASPGLI